MGLSFADCLAGSDRFNVIRVGAAIEDDASKEMLLELLKPGGRMVAPVQPSCGAQVSMNWRSVLRMTSDVVGVSLLPSPSLHLCSAVCVSVCLS
jgi:protein-L-isoaspartate O-methyltransferase